MALLNSLREILERVPSRLENLSLDTLGRKSTPTAWSHKEELGHLIDSVANNHQRIVRAQFENKLTLPGYEQNRWVAVHGYQRREWRELVGLWQALNRQLLAASEAVPGSAWSHTLTVGTSESMTLEFVFDDYIAHMIHHLEHIGIQVDDIRPKATSAA
jgi:hypothetical protein